MKKKNTSTPHDAYFKKALSYPQAAKNFLMHYLPQETLNLIQLDSLEPQNIESIDEELKKSAKDVVFRVKTTKNEEAYIYLMLEHQRNPEKLMPFRLLKYMIRLMDLHQITHKTHQLPLVIPLVLYNGSKPYPYSMDIFELFDAEVRHHARENFIKPCLLFDLSQLDVRAIKDDAWISIFINALKHGPMNTAPKRMIEILEVAIISLAEIGELSYIKTVFHYLCEIKEEHFHQELLQEFQAKLEPILEEKFMISIADAIRQEGRQEGIHFANLETARLLLHRGMSLVSVAEITRLSLEEVRIEAERLLKAAH